MIRPRLSAMLLSLSLISCSDDGTGEGSTASGSCSEATPDICGGVCVSLDHDSTNCGRCGVQCRPAESCNGGLCVHVCDDGDEGTVCGTICADLLGDSNNCGACGVVCLDNEWCIDGECTPMNTTTTSADSSTETVSTGMTTSPTSSSSGS